MNSIESGKMIIECIEEISSCDLEQGDILEFKQKNYLWNNYLVIITADCDLSKGKNQDVYSYCPFTDLENFFKYYYLPSQINIEFINQNIKNMIDKITCESIDINAIQNWIKERGSIGAIADLPKYSKDLETRIKLLESVLLWNDPVSTYIEYRKMTKGIVDEIKEVEILRSNFQSYLCNLPGDLFYFNYLHCNEKIGYIVNLRRIGMLNRCQIAVESSQRELEDVSAFRIAKMISPFRYYLTQRVGQMFSDIGLPEEYEKDRINAINVLFSAIRSNHE